MQGGLHPGGHVLVDAIREVDRRPKRSAGPSLPVRSPGGERRWRLVSFRGDSGTFGPSSLDVALTLRGDELIFSDDGPDAADARVRRGVIVWKK